MTESPLRRLLPDVASAPLDHLYAALTLPDGRARRAGVDRPWIALGMVSTVDGAATVDGHTAELGGEADRRAFSRLRAACDAVLVGAGTVRVENYGPPRGSEDRRADRRARGLEALPRMVVVSGALGLEPDHRIFEDPARRPIVVTHRDAPAERVERLSTVADVWQLGDHAVDLPAMVRELGRAGLWRILCEGGPTLNATLLADDLVDEVFLTIAPLLVGGNAPRIARGIEPTRSHPMRLVELAEHDDELLLRYRRAGE